MGWYKEWYRLDGKKKGGKQRARRLQDSLAKVRAAGGGLKTESSTLGQPVQRDSESENIGEDMV